MVEEENRSIIIVIVIRYTVDKLNDARKVLCF